MATLVLASSFNVACAKPEQPPQATVVQEESPDITPSQGEDYLKKIDSADNFDLLLKYFASLTAKGWNRFDAYKSLTQQLASEAKFSRRWFLLKILWSQLSLRAGEARDGLAGFNELLGSAPLALKVHAGAEFGEGLKWFCGLSLYEGVTGFDTLDGYQGSDERIRKALDDQVVLLKAGVEAGLRSRWPELVAGRFKIVVSPVVGPLLADPKLSRNVPMSCFVGQLLLPSDPTKALSVLDAVRSSIAKQSTEVQVPYFRASKILREKQGRFQDAANDQRQVVELTNRGRPELLRVQSLAHDRDGIFKVVQELKLRTIQPSERQLCLTILSGNPLSPLTKKESNLAVVEVLTNELALVDSARIDVVVELHRKISLAYAEAEDYPKAIEYLESIEAVTKGLDASKMPAFCKEIPGRRAWLQAKIPGPTQQ